MLNYRWITDVHLDHVRPAELDKFLAEVKGSCDADTVLLSTGDTSSGRLLAQHVHKLHDACPGRLFYVLGNHDYWGSSFADTDARLAELHAAGFVPRATFMDASDPIQLEEKLCVVGDSGWYDGRNGDQGRPRFIMNDWHYIREHLGRDPFRASAEFADARAKRLEAKLRAALTAGNERVIVITHVPPYVEACRYKGRPSDLYALPWFSSQVMSDVLDQVANEYFWVKFEVLAGHTHDPYVYRRLDNLTVHVAAAEYGYPYIAEWKPTLW